LRQRKLTGNLQRRLVQIVDNYRAQPVAASRAPRCKTPVRDAPACAY
jgi:hypothetical protein